LIHGRPDAEPLLQALQAAFAPDQVLVVPLDVTGLGQPSLQLLYVNLIDCGVPRFGGFEAPFFLKAFLVKGLTTPEE
jgi:hypothetical protein